MHLVSLFGAHTSGPKRRGDSRASLPLTIKEFQAEHRPQSGLFRTSARAAEATSIIIDQGSPVVVIFARLGSTQCKKRIDNEWALLSMRASSSYPKMW
jgi:hypothetical protein